MMQRLRERLLSFSAAVSGLISRPGRQYRPVKGCMRGVIVVKPPNPIFREAVFVLRDDYFLEPGLSREELLQQAKDAAGEYWFYNKCWGRHPTRMSYTQHF
ncbi:MAG: hypothetical protein VB039_05635 [Oscillospiraceae bacterium]|nr:hypothetical protein [Oscillospiraceae bacterium]